MPAGPDLVPFAPTSLFAFQNNCRHPGPSCFFHGAESGKRLFTHLFFLCLADRTQPE